MEREHFRCCMSVKALVNTNMIAGRGRKEGGYYERSKVATASRFELCLASYCR